MDSISFNLIVFSQLLKAFPLVFTARVPEKILLFGMFTYSLRSPLKEIQTFPRKTSPFVHFALWITAASPRSTGCMDAKVPNIAELNPSTCFCIRFRANAFFYLLHLILLSIPLGSITGHVGCIHEHALTVMQNRLIS